MFYESTKPLHKARAIQRADVSPRVVLLPDQTLSSPEVFHRGRLKELIGKPTRDAISNKESNLPTRGNDVVPTNIKITKTSNKDSSADSSGDMPRAGSSPREGRCNRIFMPRDCRADMKGPWNLDKARCCRRPYATKKSRSCSPQAVDCDDPISRQIREIHHDTRKSIRIIRDSRARLLEIQKKSTMTDVDLRELGERNELLLREMDKFDKLTRTLQRLVGAEATGIRRAPEEQQPCCLPGSIYEPPIFPEKKMNYPTLLDGGRNSDAPSVIVCDAPTTSKSEVDLSRKLSESYDMQEKLVADNADLEVKRYILYKELMAKDQNLETCRAQIKRLQGELKLMSKENSVLHERVNKNNPQGDASTVNNDSSPQYSQESEDCSRSGTFLDSTQAQELKNKIDEYYSSKVELEKQISCLEEETQHIRAEMESIKEGGACRGSGGQNTCFEQLAGEPPEPPMTRACGVCPPCPAPCNPNAPPTPAEKEAQKLGIQLRQTEDNFKTKVTECAMLRAELLKKREECENDKCQLRETQNKLRELEMKMEGLATATNMALGSKEQAFEQEVNVRTLRQCYREAREEIDELRTLMKEQDEQLQDYRVKYLQAQQLVEEQRRQMDMMDMDNTRISEQINLEIQRVKLKFQEKLQELSPIPDLLKATQLRLKDAQQSQAIAEHNAEQLARELNCAREKVHVLLQKSVKPVEKPPERGGDEKQLALLNQRIAQLTEANAALKAEIERLKSNVIRMEESVVANERRLHEKMHECAQAGGELERARDEAARALHRAAERTATMRKCLQTTIAELERQLAASRAQVKTSEKEREELQTLMQWQMKRLNENFEQAQFRILGLQTQVQTLRRTVSSTGDGEDDADQQECACKNFFDNP